MDGCPARRRGGSDWGEQRSADSFRGWIHRLACASRVQRGLREVRTGVITEITADSAIVDRLPLWLTVPNPHVTDDPSSWPEDAWYRHVDSCLDDERAWFDGRDDRVLYVNGDRWTIGKDSQGHAHAFPVGKARAENPLQQTWVDVFGLGAGLASSTIGALTPSVGAIRDYYDGIAIYYRLFALTEPAEHVADWLLSGEFVTEHRDVWQRSDEVAPDEGDLFLRLFINVVTGQSDGRGVPGSRLAPGEGMGISDLDLWTMTVDVPSDCQDAIMQRVLADHRGRYSKDHPWVLR